MVSKSTAARLAPMALALAFFAAAPQHAAFAQDAAKTGAAAGGAPVIIVIDPDRIRREAVAGKGVDMDIEKYAKGFDEENHKDEASLQAAAQQLDKEQASLTKEQIDERRHSLAIKADEVRQNEIKRRQAFEKSANIASQKLYQAMLEASRDVASAHNADIVMRSQALLFFNEHMDATNEVIELINKRVAKIDFPAPRVDDSTGSVAGQAPADPAKPAAKAKSKEKPPQQQN